MALCVERSFSRYVTLYTAVKSISSVIDTFGKFSVVPSSVVSSRLSVVASSVIRGVLMSVLSSSVDSGLLSVVS